jgi:hypothetical protein
VIAPSAKLAWQEILRFEIAVIIAPRARAAITALFTGTRGLRRARVRCCRGRGDRISSQDWCISGVVGMGLFIRDDAVRDMAKRLAKARRTTVTEAVRQALEHELADMEQNGRARERRLDAALARLDALPRRKISSDHDLYDDQGTPVL